MLLEGLKRLRDRSKR